MPLRAIITQGTRADCSQASRLIEGLSAEYLLADKGYDTNDILAQVRAQNMRPVIPPKKNRKEQRAYDKSSPTQRHWTITAISPIWQLE